MNQHSSQDDAAWHARIKHARRSIRAILLLVFLLLGYIAWQLIK